MNKQANVKPSADSLKKRVIRAKEDLGSVEYVPLYAFMFGPLDDSLVHRIRNVWNLKIADVEITENLEKLARRNKNK